MVCAFTTPLHILYQGSPHHGPLAKSDLRSHFNGRKTHFANNEKIMQYIYEKCVELVKCSISRKSHITQDVWPSNCCAIAYVVFPKKFEAPWSI